VLQAKVLNIIGSDVDVIIKFLKIMSLTLGKNPRADQFIAFLDRHLLT
jgi:hypothetical protein